MLLGFKVGFKAGPREGAYGYQRRRGIKRQKRKGASWRKESVRSVHAPSVHAELQTQAQAAAFKGALAFGAGWSSKVPCKRLRSG